METEEEGFESDVTEDFVGEDKPANKLFDSDDEDADGNRLRLDSDEEDDSEGWSVAGINLAYTMIIF